MKRIGRYLLFGFIITMLSLFCIIPGTVSEAATVKLNKTKKTLYIGDTFKLKLKNAKGTIKFVSTDTDVVTVSSKGKVTAKGAGKATVKVTYKSNTYKCKFTVKEDTSNTSDQPSNKTLSDEYIYNAVMGMQDEYPEGTPWTNANSYMWGYNAVISLGYSSYGGYGCMGFAIMASDVVFGKDTPVYQYYDKSQIRVGDILRINNDTHSVIAIKIDGNMITIAEGNYNSSIHYGRVIDIDKSNFVYGFTRQPLE